LKRNYAGCAICNSTWGDFWADVDGERMFFCCELCAVQFRGLVERIKRETGWRTIESLDIAGDRRGRSCHATGGGDSFRCRFAFNPQGEIRRFERLSPNPS
jgi:putative zinc binding protein